MFGNSSKKDNMATGNSQPVSYGSNSINSLGQGTRIEGDIHAQNDIRIDGELKGTLTCEGKLIVGPKGDIDGKIKCKNGVIEGTIKGELEVVEVLNVRETAKISGTVNTGQLIVQSGAVFNVSCVMGGQKLSVGKGIIKEKASIETSKG